MKVLQVVGAQPSESGGGDITVQTPDGLVTLELDAIGVTSLEQVAGLVGAASQRSDGYCETAAVGILSLAVGIDEINGTVALFITDAVGRKATYVLEQGQMTELEAALSLGALNLEHLQRPNATH